MGGATLTWGTRGTGHVTERAPLFDPTAPRTTGETRGDRVVRTGVRSLVSYAASAELIVVSAMVDGTPSLVIVEPGGPGLHIEDEPAMGIRAGATGRATFSELGVGKANLVGRTGDHRDAVYRARVAWSGAACGTAQAALDQSIPYLSQRPAFGAPIAHRQAVAVALADRQIQLLVVARRRLGLSSTELV